MGSKLHRIDGGWIEVRADGVTVWRENGDTIEPVVTVSAADLMAAGVPAAASPQPQPRRPRAVPDQLQLPRLEKESKADPFMVVMLLLAVLVFYFMGKNGSAEPAPA